MLRKTIIIVSLVLIAAVSALRGQQINFVVNDSTPGAGEKELTANFIGFNTFGEAPLSAFFKDMSTGGPTSWCWQFGDGDTAVIQNPTHVYQQPGLYTVILTVSNGDDTASFKRKDYIRVAATGGCDSLNYPLPGQYALYTISGNGSGYISGNSSFGTLAKASYFDDFPEGGELIAGIFDFAVAVRSLTNNIPVWFKAWDATGNGGGPGNVLDSISVPIADIIDDVEQGNWTMVFFDSAVLLDGPFYLGVELPQIYGDTLALYTNYHGDVENGNAWTMDSLGHWMPYTETQWSLNVDHAIFPVVCQPVAVENHLLEKELLVYPVPASEQVNFVFTDPSVKITSVELFDMTGRKLMTHIINGVHFGSADARSFPPGFYFLKLNTSAGALVRKILVK